MFYMLCVWILEHEDQVIFEGSFKLDHYNKQWEAENKGQMAELVMALG